MPTPVWLRLDQPTRGAEAVAERYARASAPIECTRAQGVLLADEGQSH